MSEVFDISEEMSKLRPGVSIDVVRSGEPAGVEVTSSGDIGGELHGITLFVGEPEASDPEEWRKILAWIARSYDAAQKTADEGQDEESEEESEDGEDQDV